MTDLAMGDRAKEERSTHSLRDDLSTLSCFAAVKLEMLVFGQRPPPLEDVERLVKKLESWIPRVRNRESPRSLLDTNMVVAMSNALSDVESTSDPWTAVVEGAMRMKDLLSRIVKDAAGFQSTPQGQEELREARTLCSRFSRSLQAMEEPPDWEQSFREVRESAR